MAIEPAISKLRTTRRPVVFNKLLYKKSNNKMVGMKSCKDDCILSMELVTLTNSLLQHTSIYYDVIMPCVLYNYTLDLLILASYTRWRTNISFSKVIDFTRSFMTSQWDVE